MKQGAPDQRCRREILSEDTVVAMLAIFIVVLETAWISAMAWGLFKAVNWMFC